MLRCSGSSQYPGSSVLDELQLSIGLLWKAQWCSLRDTQVYAVYPLGKDKDLRIPT